MYLVRKENKMKKLLTIILSIAMIFSLAACSSGGGESTEPAAAEPANEW